MKLRSVTASLHTLFQRPSAPGWILGENGEEVHVLPINDLIDHTDAECVCGTLTEPVPRDDGSMGWLVSHFSLDGRESLEKP
jgi:hypothetical protein